jgi:hypothetical protein
MNTEATKKIKEIFNDKIFQYSKPFELIEKIIEQATNDGDYVLDSFAGSGTTAHSILNLNSKINGSRKFILVELDNDISQAITAKRIKKVIEGYTYSDNKGKIKEVSGKGGGFRFCTLGESLFDADGNIADAVSFSDLAAHVFFCETGAPIPKRTVSASALIGQFETRAIYLLYAKDSAGVPSVKKGNVLDGKTLDALPQAKDGITHCVVYAEGCTLSDTRLRKAGVSFKHIP